MRRVRKEAWLDTLESGERFRRTLLPTIGEVYSEIFEKEVNYKISNALEIGVGTGFPIRSMLEIGKSKLLLDETIFLDKTIFLDIEEILVRTSKDKISNFSLLNKFIVADAKFLPFKEETIDLIFGCSIFNIFSQEELELVLKECYNVLSKNSKLLIIDEASPVITELGESESVRKVFINTLEKYNLIGQKFFERLDRFFLTQEFYNKQELKNIKFRDVFNILISYFSEEEKKNFKVFKKNVENEKKKCSWEEFYLLLTLLKRNLESIRINEHQKLIYQANLKFIQIFNRIKFLLYHSYLYQCLENTGFRNIEIKRINKRNKFQNLEIIRRFGNCSPGDYIYIDGTYNKSSYVPFEYLASQTISFPYVVAEKL